MELLREMIPVLAGAAVPPLAELTTVFVPNLKPSKAAIPWVVGLGFGASAIAGELGPLTSSLAAIALDSLLVYVGARLSTSLVWSRLGFLREAV